MQQLTWKLIGRVCNTFNKSSACVWSCKMSKTKAMKISASIISNLIRTMIFHRGKGAVYHKTLVD